MHTHSIHSDKNKNCAFPLKICVLNELFIRSLFYVTCLSYLVFNIFRSVSFSCKNYKHGRRKGNFIFSKDITAGVCLDLLQFFLITD